MRKGVSNAAHRRGSVLVGGGTAYWVYAGYLALLSLFFRRPKPQLGDPPALANLISTYEEASGGCRTEFERLEDIELLADLAGTLGSPCSQRF